jgi:hypothetical protein
MHQEKQFAIRRSCVVDIYLGIGSKALQQDLKPCPRLRVIGAGIMLDAVWVGENRESHGYF